MPMHMTPADLRSISKQPEGVCAFGGAVSFVPRQALYTASVTLQSSLLCLDLKWSQLWQHRPAKHQCTASDSPKPYH